MVLFTRKITARTWRLSAVGDMEVRENFDCIPEIDFNSGYRYFLGNFENYAQAMMSTLKSIKAKLPILQTMYRTVEFEGLRTITQTLQRMTKNIGANDVAEFSYQLETALLNRTNTELQDLLADYIDCLQEFSINLGQLLKKLDMKFNRKNQEEEISFLKYDFTKTKESIKLSANLLERKII